MHEEDSGVPTSRVLPCGHANAPSAHFCETCGVERPMRCPRCATQIRRQANFCSHCGIDLRAKSSGLPKTATDDGRATPSASSLSGKERAPDLGEGSERFNEIRGFVQRRRRRRRLAWVWLGLGTISASVVIGLFVGALVRSAQRHVVVDATNPDTIGTPGDGGRSAAIAQRVAAS